jgi:hypothetical protein
MTTAQSITGEREVWLLMEFELGPSQPDYAWSRGALLLALGMTLAVSITAVGLARVEGRGTGRTLGALGAAPGIRRRMSGWYALIDRRLRHPERDAYRHPARLPRHVRVGECSIARACAGVGSTRLRGAARRRGRRVAHAGAGRPGTAVLNCGPNPAPSQSDPVVIHLKGKPS